MRFDGLDRLKAVALWAMLLHHLLAWCVGGARDLLGTSEMAVTDLAAPAFAVAAGAGAVVVGGRLRDRGGAGTGAVLRRWAVIAAWGVLLGLSRDQELDTVGVLETLAVVGVVITLTARWRAPSAATWAITAGVLTVASTPVVELATSAGGWWHAAFGHRFPTVSYLAMGATGAAVAVALGSRERPARLLAIAGAGVVILAVLGLVGAGVWPPARYPSGPALILPGVAAAVTAWAVLSLLPPSPLTRGMERAGRRTLLVYVGHYAIRSALDATGWYQELDGAGWTAAAVALAAAIAAASALPRPAPTRGGRRSAGLPDPADVERRITPADSRAA